jgi:hypothetical protein
MDKKATLEQLEDLFLESQQAGDTAGAQEVYNLINELETEIVREDYDAKPYWRQAMQSFEDVGRTAGHTLGIGDPEEARRSMMQLGPLAPAAASIPFLAQPSNIGAGANIFSRMAIGGAEGATSLGLSSALQGKPEEIPESMLHGGIWGTGGQLIGEAASGIANVGRNIFNKVTGRGPDPNLVIPTQPSELAVRDTTRATAARQEAIEAAEIEAQGVLSKARQDAADLQASRQQAAADYRAKAQQQAADLVESTKQKNIREVQERQAKFAREQVNVEQRARGMLESAEVEALTRQNAAQDRLVEAKKAMTGPKYDRLVIRTKQKGTGTAANKYRKEAEAELKKLQKEHDTAQKNLQKITQANTLKQQKTAEKADKLTNDLKIKQQEAGAKQSFSTGEAHISAQERADKLSNLANEKARIAEEKAVRDAQQVEQRGAEESERVKGVLAGKAESQYSEATKGIPTQADKIEMVKKAIEKGKQRAESDVATGEGRTTPKTAQQDIREGERYQYFNNEEKEALEGVIKGNLPLRAARQVGRIGFSPAIEAGQTALGGVMGGPVGLAAVLAAQTAMSGIGAAGRAISNKLTDKAGKEALRVVMGQPKQKDVLPPELLEALRRLSLGAAND